MSEYLKWTHTKCPYCGHRNRIRLDVAQHSKHIATCDIEEGGCDKDYVIETIVYVDTNVYSLCPQEGATP